MLKKSHLGVIHLNLPNKSRKEYFKLYWQKYKGQRKKKL